VEEKNNNKTAKTAPSKIRVAEGGEGDRRKPSNSP